MEAVYAPFLPKHTHPFIYLSLHIKPQHLDVNVHPTKQKVCFLNEDKIVEFLCEEIEKLLSQHNTSRQFLTQVSY